mmetsp:Transcript_69247/g.162105  ORF Transcript_69247/g.162105 Transcript_69247/m.162105 type:complete len:282 (-) Transcript_69247:1064-1909(-)
MVVLRMVDVLHDALFTLRHVVPVVQSFQSCGKPLLKLQDVAVEVFVNLQEHDRQVTRCGAQHLRQLRPGSGGNLAVIIPQVLATLLLVPSADGRIGQHILISHPLRLLRHRLLHQQEAEIHVFLHQDTDDLLKDLRVRRRHVLGAKHLHEDVPQMGRQGCAHCIATHDQGQRACHSNAHRHRALSKQILFRLEDEIFDCHGNCCVAGETAAAVCYCSQNLFHRSVDRPGDPLRELLEVAEGIHQRRPLDHVRQVVVDHSLCFHQITAMMMPMVSSMLLSHC